MPTTKRNDGADEPILDPQQCILDSHMHLFDGRPTQRYMLEDYLAHAAGGHRIVASVYVETLAFTRADGPELLRPLGEIEFANGVGAIGASGVYGPCRVCAAIVGYADLTAGDAIANYLDRALQLAPDRLRGIRQMTIEDPTGLSFRHMMKPPPTGILCHPGFRKGFRHLEPRGLPFDAAVFQHQMPEIADLADAFPDTTIILNHMGIAMAMGKDAKGRQAVFREWSAHLRDVARRPNVLCKVGGLGMPPWALGFDERPGAVGYLELAAAWEPFVHTAIEAFGADRCMLASNFPPDGRSCGYVPLWNALKHILRDASSHEKAALFMGTASRAYHLDIPT